MFWIAARRRAGDAVLVIDPNGKPLGTAHYSAHRKFRCVCSRIAPKPLTARSICAGLREAQAYRQRVVTRSSAYRLVHGEADRLPGLVIDRYGDYFSIQTLDQGMDHAKPEIVSAVQELFAPLGIVERNDVPVRKRENLPLQSWHSDG